ncbi:kinase-like protein [Lenzites betulinus]|nr:kinase-like protein [Lenzites betulinus]
MILATIFILVVDWISSPRGAKEADIIRFVQRHTSIPTPRVIASDDGYGNRYLLMKKQLRSFVSQLRTLQSPHGRSICSLDGDALNDARFTGFGLVGPFANEDAFNERLIQTTANYNEFATLPEVRARLRVDHAVVFTHGDIAPRNIMVKGDTIVALLDWEQAGWYPEHWEFMKAVWCPPSPKSEGDVWIEVVEDLFDKDYKAEWEVERYLTEHIVGFF